jgi:hypothetical protein
MKTSLDLLAKVNNVLVLAVGGGNDSVSTLLLQKQLQESFGYSPEKISIVAVLPDCLDYQQIEPTNHSLIGIITPETTRSVQGKVIEAFPERILSTYKNQISTLPVMEVYGISMREGSVGIAKALIHLIDQENFDLILAIDVGGDFIAVPENIEVLSPMMDGYMLYALKELDKYQQVNTKKIPIVYSVFGLGTDGESTPEMLRAALAAIPEIYEGQFFASDVKNVIDFYRTKVEPNRYSRTADFTIKEIEGIGHDNPAAFRGRFHVGHEQGSHKHYGVFEHAQDSYFFGKYYLFDSIETVNNPFAVKCNNGVEWFVAIQKAATKINHELNGQAYNNLGLVFNNIELQNKSLFFGTPSRKFNEVSQKAILEQTLEAVKSHVYDLAIVYKHEFQQTKDILNLFNVELNNDLVVIAYDENILKNFKKSIHQGIN